MNPVEKHEARGMQYRILLHKEPEGGYTVIVPTLPGSVTKVL